MYCFVHLFLERVGAHFVVSLLCECLSLMQTTHTLSFHPPQVQKFFGQQTNSYSVTCLSLFMWELSLGLLGNREENQLYICKFNTNKFLGTKSFFKINFLPLSRNCNWEFHLVLFDAVFLLLGSLHKKFVQLTDPTEKY